MVYKSSLMMVIISFFKVLLAICAITAALFGLVMMLLSALGISTGRLDMDVALPVIYAVTGIVAVVAAYMAFYRYNIKVEITDEAIKFFRGRKEYQSFPYASFAFTSYVHKQSYNLIPVSTSRYLRVITKAGGKFSNYKCHNFSNKTFEEFMIRVDAHPLNDTRELVSETPDTQKKETAQTIPSPTEYKPESRDTTVFIIDKQLLIKKYRKPFLYLFILFSAMIIAMLLSMFIVSPGSFFDQLAINAIFFGSLTVVLLPIPVIMFGIPMIKIKKDTPEKITFYSDRITLDDREYYFSRIKQIRVTPPSYKGKTRNLRRKVTIVEDRRTSTFIAGDSSDILPATIRKGKPRVFADYEAFCHKLETLLINEPGKFVLVRG